MAINVSQAFKRTSKNPIDETFALTKAQMLTVNDNLMPDYYFTVCQDDGCFYLYDKTATASLTTGKFTKFEGGTDNLVFGYLNSTNGKFYKESTYTTEIAGDTSKLYITLDTNYLYRYDNGFVQIGGSSVGGTVEGYLNPTDGKFYEESTYATEITGEAGKLYVTLDTDKTYRYDSTNGFVEVGGGDTIQYSTMPTADATTLGKFVQYIGATTSSYMHGYFYECVSDGAGTPTYSWEVRNVQDSEQIQYAVMPTADSAHENMIVQYTGATNSTYTNGLFYVCVSDGAVTPTYSWEQKPVEPKEVVRIAKADFDLLPIAKKNDGRAYFIPDADMVDNITVMGNRFDKANIYTATERMVGSWMGKPLYQKTIDCGTLPNNASKDVYHGISDLSRIVSVIGSADDGSTYFPLPYVHDTTIGNQVGIIINTTKIIVLSRGANMSSYNGHVTVRYTKTTDGTVTIGSPNDYSTDEMIIGTWIDGSTLYQKTFDFGELPSSAGLKSLDMNVTNLKTIISIEGVATSGVNDASYVFPITFINTNDPTNESLIGCYYSGGTKKLCITVGQDRSAMKHAFITVKYLKTT